MNKAKEHFNESAEKYETLIEKIVTGYETFFNQALSLIPEGKTEILELGSGTGYLTEKIIAGNPEASVTCIDMTPEMLGIAMAKDTLKDVSFIEGDFTKVWPEKKFDIIISTLCFHHLNDEDRKAAIQKVHESLNDGGVFVNGDVFKPNNDFIEELLNRRWLDSMIKNGLSEKQALDMANKRKSALPFIDTPEDYREKLLNAGFKRHFCFYSYEIYSIFAAYK
ncbi:MAG: class I SAM-dependent methyltransferase [Methanomicrobiaceae archaeon]|nr:class I SAM-dependent methyltransferase [Methanomicrobiaceae archaeon]